MTQGSHFNLASVSKNSVLTILKSTQLSKFYKKVSLIQPFNYRPISLLPLIPKVIEKTSTFLNSKNLLYTYQSGFWKKAFYRFLPFLLQWQNFNGFEKDLMTGMILFDLQKAFDKIDHDVLLQKLYAIGFSKHTVNWFQSYLSNRSFLVNLGNNFSQPASVSCGVPRGSILGPLLVLIYVNDMS